jgi:hypothetical protein
MGSPQVAARKLARITAIRFILANPPTRHLIGVKAAAVLRCRYGGRLGDAFAAAIAANEPGSLGGLLALKAALRITLTLHAVRSE